jgi:hypothetical protein
MVMPRPAVLLPARHNVPGEDTWQGEWGADEIERFVQARAAAGRASLSPLRAPVA